MQTFVGKTKCIAGYMKVANMGHFLNLAVRLKTLLSYLYLDLLVMQGEIGSRLLLRPM